MSLAVNVSKSDIRLLPRRTPRQARSTETRAILLEATGRALSRGGSITSRKIADIAGVSVGSLYQYYPTKEAMLSAWEDARVDAAFVEIAAMIGAVEQVSSSLFGEVLGRIRALVREVAPSRRVTSAAGRDAELTDVAARAAALFTLRYAEPMQRSRVLIALAAAIGANAAHESLAPTAASDAALLGLESLLAAHVGDEISGECAA